jgi:hypothetical protein
MFEGAATRVVSSVSLFRPDSHFANSLNSRQPHLHPTDSSRNISGTRLRDPPRPAILSNALDAVAVTHTSRAKTTIPAESGVTHNPENSPTQTPKALFERSLKAIRCREEVTSWYSSQDPAPLSSPPTAPPLFSDALQEGDLFIHMYRGGVQSWIWAGTSWMPVKECHPHPSIEGYCFFLLENNDPTWVTRRTVVTYRGKKRKGPA